MLYNQPYGVSDPNAPYINGNPSTGTMGSIPPAASIEYPQREIVNLINDAGIVPDNGDLHQLAKGVQSGRLIYGDDIGAVNQVSLAVSPPVTALSKGMQFVTIFAHDNTGPASASVSGLPFAEIVHPSDRTSLQPLDLRAGAIACLAYDGSKFQLAWAQTPIGAPVFLTASLDYYVGGAGASDLNDGTTAAVSGIHGPFATLQKAMDTIANFNLNGHDINVHVADGNYVQVALGNMNGTGDVNWIGNPATPANCLIVGTNASAILASNVGGAHILNGFAVQTSGTSSVDPLCGITVTGTNSILQFNDIQYNACAGSHIAVAQAAVAAPGGKQIINGNAQGGVPLMSSGWHVWCFSGGIVQGPTGAPPVLTITGAFGGGNGGGFIQANVLSYAGLVYGSMTGAANWSGYKYSVSANSIMTNNGSGVNYYPGSIAGVASNGGQYF